MAKNYYYSITVIISLFIISSCAQGSTSTGDKAAYQLNVTVDPPEAGNVTPSSAELAEGEEVEITASSNEGWIFDRWQGDQTGTANPVTITMDKDKDILALFIKKEYPLTISIEGEGDVSERVVNNKITDYPHGTMVELTANPATGWVFSHWEGDVDTEGNPVQIVIDSEKEVTAVFVTMEFDLVIQTEGEGNVSERMIQDSSSPYQIVELTATPSDGWRFVEWKGDISGSDNPAEITMDREKEVTAVFEENEEETVFFELSSTTDGEGSISPESGEFEEGTDVELTASPADGWSFSNWDGDLSGSENPQTITMDSDKSVMAVFEEETAFSGGDGSSGNPYQVSNIEELQRVANYPDAHFVQINNIDASATSSWNEGDGFKPVGSFNSSFSGTYNGGGFEISGLTINRPNEEYVGLFGNVDGAVIKNIGLVNITIVGYQDVGGLIGVIYRGGIIENSHAAGNVSGTRNIGGLAGNISGTKLSNSHAIVEVSGEVSVGGLVGVNGSLGGRIVDSYAGGDVSGSEKVGGLVGVSSRQTTIQNSHATGTVTGTGNQIGGLVGLVDYGGHVSDSHATGNVMGGERVGGLIGDNGGGSITSCYATGNVSGSSMLGGLVGKIVGPGAINRSHASGNVSGNSLLGGLVGSKHATHINDSFALGEITGEERIGGLAGESIAGQIKTSYALGRVNGKNVVGGLVGVNDTDGHYNAHDAGQIFNSYAHGAVTGDVNVGGLAGINRNQAVITTSYAKGMVSGGDNTGGLVGLNEAEIVSSYWDSEATGQSDGAGDGSTEGTTGLTTTEMTGASAETNIPEFDWSSIWMTTAEYPILIWQDVN